MLQPRGAKPNALESKKSALKNGIAKKKRQDRVALERSDKKRCYKMGITVRRRWSGSSASTWIGGEMRFSGRFWKDSNPS